MVGTALESVGVIGPHLAYLRSLDAKAVDGECESAKSQGSRMMLGGIT